jgi:glucose 1-dehydrogenase
MYSDQPLAGKVALVTGSSKGIGAGIAIEFGKAGADVCVNYAGSRADAERVAEQIHRSSGRRAIAVYADAGKREDVEQMVEACTGELGPIDILVTNAIASSRASILETRFEEFYRTVELGIFGTFHAMQLVARQMVARGAKGSIIHISSPHARGPFKNAIDYNTTKAGSHHLAMSVANELMWHQIRVNILEPGWTDTPGERRFYSDELIKAFGDRMPLKRMGLPEDLGRAAVYLASDMADYVVGTVLKVDGGQFIEGGPSWEAKSRHE